MGLPIDPVNASWKSSVGGIRDPARPRLARSILRHFGRKLALRRRLSARHRIANEPVLRCSYHPDDRRDHDSPDRDDS